MRVPVPGSLPRRLSLVGVLLLVALAVAAPLVAPAVAVAAQATPPAAAGITVTGYGEASAPAASAKVQVLITQGEPVSMRPPFIPPGATPGTAAQGQAAPVVDALVAGGVTRSGVSVIVSPLPSANGGPGGPPVARVDFTLRPVSVDQLRRLIGAAVVAASGEGLTIGTVGVQYGVGDCQPLERAARTAAIADGRQRAALQADLLHVALGDVTASVDQPTNQASLASPYGLPFQPSACAPPEPAGAASLVLPLGVTFPAYDPAKAAEVEVYAQVSLTFAVTK